MARMSPHQGRCRKSANSPESSEGTASPANARGRNGRTSEDVTHDIPGVHLEAKRRETLAIPGVDPSGEDDAPEIVSRSWRSGSRGSRGELWCRWRSSCGSKRSKGRQHEDRMVAPLGPSSRLRAADGSRWTGVARVASFSMRRQRASQSSSLRAIGPSSFAPGSR